MTPADSAQALGMSLDGAEVSPPIGFAHGDSETHSMVPTPPDSIESGDIYRHDGEWRTVSVRVPLASGETALYFAEPYGGVNYRAVIGVDVREVTVYRPKFSYL
jgi:hypothetical protein